MLMSFFKHSSKLASVNVDLSGVYLDEFLKSYLIKEEGSPFAFISWDVEAEELPEQLLADESVSLDVDVLMTFVEEKENLSFWKMEVFFDTETRDYRWYCYVVVNSTSLLECRTAIKRFLANQLHLQAYIHGTLHEKLNVASIARLLIAGHSSNASSTDKIIPSNN